jgi:hypothetical protein
MHQSPVDRQLQLFVEQESSTDVDAFVASLSASQAIHFFAAVLWVHCLYSFIAKVKEDLKAYKL